MNNSPWVEKYRPMSMENIVLTNENRKILQNMLDKDYIPNLLFHGPPGTGKSTIARIILEEFNYDIIEFNASDVRNQKLISSKIKELIGQSNIINMMMFKPKKIAIIMDEIDGMSSGDRGGLSELIKLNINLFYLLSTFYLLIIY